MAEETSEESPDDSRRGFLKKLVRTGAGVALVGAGLEADSEVSGLPQLIKLQLRQDIKDHAPTAEQLWQNPASHSSLAILSLLSYGETQIDADSISGNKTRLNIEFSNHSNPPSAKFPHRAELRDVSMQDPADSGSTLNYKMIAHHRDVSTSLDICVFFDPTQNTLMFVCPGVDNLSDLKAVNTTVMKREDPAVSGVSALMQDVMEQVQDQGLNVQHTVIFGHSIGAAPATHILAHCLRDKPYRQLLKGQEPKVALLEEWSARLSAEHIAAHRRGPSVDELAQHITSVRRIPATFTAQPENHVLGKRAEAIVPKFIDTLKMDEWTMRQNGHRASVIAQDLLGDEARVVAARPGELDAAQATLFTHELGVAWDKLAAVERDVDTARRHSREIIGGTVLAGAVVLEERLRNRKNQLREETRQDGKPGQHER